MGTSRVDLHVKILDDTVVDLAVARGLDAIVYAPHFTPWPEIVRRARSFTDDDLVVVPGREVFTGHWSERKHVLGLDLGEPIPDFVPLDRTMDALRSQGACVIAPHPTYLTVSLSPDDLERYRDDIDAIETYNPRLLPWHPPRSRRLADALDTPQVASSYAHLRRSVGAASIELRRPVTSPADVVAAIRDGAIEAIRRPTLPARIGWSLPELGHLLWENSASKLLRKLTPGAVATHPSADVYRQYGWSDTDAATFDG